MPTKRMHSMNLTSPFIQCLTPNELWGALTKEERAEKHAHINALRDGENVKVFRPEPELIMSEIYVSWAESTKEAKMALYRLRTDPRIAPYFAFRPG